MLKIPSFEDLTGDRREAPPERGGELDALRLYQRQIFSFICLTCVLILPVAVVQLLWDWSSQGHLSRELLVAAVYIVLWAIMAYCLWKRGEARLEPYVQAFGVAALGVMLTQFVLCPGHLRWVVGLEAIFLSSILYLLMAPHAFKQFLIVELGLGLLALLMREWFHPAPVQVRGWDEFNVVLVPAAIFTMIQAAVIVLSVRLRQLLVRHLKALRALSAQEAELRQAHRDLGLFVLAASHDLRQPLRQIVSFMQLLKRRHANDLKDGDLAYVDSAVIIAGRMEGLLEDLLRYSKAGSEGLNLRWHDAASLLRQAFAGLEADWVEEGATLTVETMPWVLADGPLVVGVFQNLLGNCLKYRDPGRPLVVRVRGEQEEGRFWRLSVQDNGLGLAENEQAGLFEAFRRAHPGVNYPGHGIGLAYCRKVVELHHGRIWLESVDHAGSTLHFTLPGLAEQP